MSANILTLDSAFTILEKYYESICDWYNEGNCESYDVDKVLTKEHLEKILLNRNLNEEDIDFLRSLYTEEDLEENVKEALSYIIIGVS